VPGYRTVAIGVGQPLIVRLRPGYDWSFTCDDRADEPLTLLAGLPPGAQSALLAVAPGTTTFHAVGRPPCERDPACLQELRAFSATIQVLSAGTIALGVDASNGTHNRDSAGHNGAAAA